MGRGAGFEASSACFCLEGGVAGVINAFLKVLYRFVHTVLNSSLQHHQLLGLLSRYPRRGWYHSPQLWFLDVLPPSGLSLVASGCFGASLPLLLQSLELWLVFALHCQHHLSTFLHSICRFRFCPCPREFGAAAARLLPVGGAVGWCCCRAATSPATIAIIPSFGLALVLVLTVGAVTTDGTSCFAPVSVVIWALRAWISARNAWNSWVWSCSISSNRLCTLSTSNDRLAWWSFPSNRYRFRSSRHQNVSNSSTSSLSTLFDMARSSSHSAFNLPIWVRSWPQSSKARIAQFINLSPLTLSSLVTSLASARFSRNVLRYWIGPFRSML